MTQMLEDSIRCTAKFGAHRCVLHAGHVGKHETSSAIQWGNERIPIASQCWHQAEDGRLCILPAKHSGDHNFGMAGIADIPVPMPTHAVTIGDRDFPAWQADIRRAQLAKNKAAEFEQASREAKKLAEVVTESEMIADLLERAGLPRGERVISDEPSSARRIDDYVFSLYQNAARAYHTYLVISIHPISQPGDPEMYNDVMESREDVYRDLHDDTMISRDGSGIVPSNLHDPDDFKAWIANTFDRLERNYAAEVHRIEVHRTKVRIGLIDDKPALPVKSSGDMLSELIAALIDEALDNRGLI